MPLSQRQNEPKPQVFLSFAGEDVEWKRRLMKPTWWKALTRVADVYDYEDRSTQFGDLPSKMKALVQQSSAFIPILSKYYIEKGGVIEDEFMTAVRKFGEVRDREKLFCPIVIDLDSKTWWDEGHHPAFAQNEWLRKTIYFELIEGKGPALLTGDRETSYARQVRTFVEKIAECIEPVGEERSDLPSPSQGSIIVLGHPKFSPSDYGLRCKEVITARNELVAGLRAGSGRVEEWADGWFRDTGPARDPRTRTLKGSVKTIVRPLCSAEADDVAISPSVTADQLSFVAGSKLDSSELSNLKITLWLPSSERSSDDSHLFLEKCRQQGSDANPRFCASSPRELGDLLVPGLGGRLTQISMEMLDDRQMIQDGRSAREILEYEVKCCVLEGASRAKITGDKPVVRSFANHIGLANQISEAKNGRIVLVAHDLTEHAAASNSEAHRMLGGKVRRLTEKIEADLRPIRGRFVPIALVVTNYSVLRNDLTLDEEIAGMKWRLLPGELDRGRFKPEPDTYELIVSDIAAVLQREPAV